MDHNLIIANRIEWLSSTNSRYLQIAIIWDPTTQKLTDTVAVNFAEHGKFVASAKVSEVTSGNYPSGSLGELGEAIISFDCGDSAWKRV